MAKPMSQPLFPQTRHEPESFTVCVFIISFSSGIQGFLTHIDDNGDAEGNYTVLSLQHYAPSYYNKSMLPVGHFQINANSSDLPVS